jgi:hypothetical protein
VADLTVTWLSREPGAVRLLCAETTAWPLGVLSMDVEFIAPDGSVVSTDTKTITLVEDVTR